MPAIAEGDCCGLEASARRASPRLESPEASLSPLALSLSLSYVLSPLLIILSHAVARLHLLHCATADVLLEVRLDASDGERGLHPKEGGRPPTPKAVA